MEELTKLQEAKDSEGENLQPNSPTKELALPNLNDTLKILNEVQAVDDQLRDSLPPDATPSPKMTLTIWTPSQTKSAGSPPTWTD